MRLFQNSGTSPSYHSRLASLVRPADHFEAQKQVFLHDRYGASHLLKPVLENASGAFFTNGDDERLQRAWARENGLRDDTPLADILLAQIEANRADVFYNLDPIRFDSDFLKRLPGHVKRTIAWRAAPGKSNFSGYDLVVSNFPSIRAGYEAMGIRTAEFFPAHDPELDAYAGRGDRDIDVLFFGGFSRHHQRRREILDTVARLGGRFRVVFHLDNSRYTKLAETPLGWFGPLAAVRRPASIRRVANPPVFGREMYAQLSRAKIVINAAIDMAGGDRGNMRCFEAMGAGALLLTDAGNYPPGMVDGRTMSVYADAKVAVGLIEQSLSDGSWRNIAAASHSMIRSEYSKEKQMAKFLTFV
ncbi:glycosyltransferase [Mesorhizobium sp.]|uniref:glycosyltransferase family protein n=1 Tax=Mesorhizobium sp. TaxID=1871066 RepID=UPI000FE7F60F|nr:glycosyltransferase [Mesorhizobium sp.]RWQ53023.1 MAG: glycosyltransferase family 1 protein [Mesorhizobium sp.]